MRILIQLKRGENAQVILNRLFKFTQLQISYGIIMLALDSRNQPVTFDLKGMLEAFIAHRKDVVTRRCIFDLKKAEARAHILEGLRRALDQIDAIIKTIRASKEADIARASLISEFRFSEKQAQAILEMRLQRLTGLERQKILDELKEVSDLIAWLKKVLGSVEEIYRIIVQELEEIRQNYGDERRTKIERTSEDLEDEDLIAKEDDRLTMTNSGYIKRIAVDEYRLQKRGGKGLKGRGKAAKKTTSSRVFSANTHTMILLTSPIAANSIGQGSWHSARFADEQKAKRSTMSFSLANGEQVRAILPVEEFKTDNYVVMLTEKGTIKKTSLE